MTKNVRIENADNNLSKKIIVDMWEDIETGEQGAHKHLVSSEELIYPAQMTTKCVHSSNWLVIREEDV